MAQIIAKNKTEEVADKFTNPTQAPTVMDEQSPSIKVIVQGQELLRSVVDGGSGMNVINKLTCDRLCIKWETCPFWFRIADTSTIRPLGLIR